MKKYAPSSDGTLREKVEIILIDIIDYAFEKGLGGDHNPNYIKAEKFRDQLLALFDEERERILNDIWKFIDEDCDWYQERDGGWVGDVMVNRDEIEDFIIEYKRKLNTSTKIVRGNKKSE